MADTIEWLETIGKNARLRHATAEELAQRLAQTDASDTLKAAVACGDRSLLSAELGHKLMHGDTGSNTHPHPHPHPEREQPDPGHGKPDPAQPPKPDQDIPSHDR